MVWSLLAWPCRVAGHGVGVSFQGVLDRCAAAGCYAAAPACTAANSHLIQFDTGVQALQVACEAMHVHGAADPLPPVCAHCQPLDGLWC